ncbi:hypothetical protein ACFYQA_17155 [Streptomyces sp. NPDC005774]|uniref:hypothetical protein n=1 Tax=Streptomyces sp. NPDC005774 TaxID=3364728 RepID=UPI003679D021
MASIDASRGAPQRTGNRRPRSRYGDPTGPASRPDGTLSCPAEPAPEPVEPPRALPTPGPEAHAAAPAAPVGSKALAETGADRTLPVLATGVTLFLGGVALYRRSRPGAGTGAQA